MDLATISMDLQALLVTGADLERKQEAMGVGVYDNEFLLGMIEAAESNTHLWGVMRDLRGIVATCLKAQWQCVACNDLTHTLYRMKRTLARSVRAPNPAVVAWATDTADKTMALVATIKCLQSAVLVERHKQAMVLLLGRDIFDSAANEYVPLHYCPSPVLL
jgi:hypothetical protein